jgi:hypothetical protein
MNRKQLWVGGARSALFSVLMSLKRRVREAALLGRNPVVMTSLYVDDNEKILKISDVNISSDKFITRNVASDNKNGKF